MALVAKPAKPLEPGEEHRVEAGFDVERTLWIKEPPYPLGHDTRRGERNDMTRYEHPGIATRGPLCYPTLFEHHHLSPGPPEKVGRAKTDDTPTDDHYIYLALHALCC